MQETSVLRELVDHHNIPTPDNKNAKQTQDAPVSAIQQPRPTLAELLHVSTRCMDFGLCLPGSVHEKGLTISMLKHPLQKMQLSLFVVCEDEDLNEMSELVFGINQVGQSEYYDDYRVNVTKKGKLEFKVGVKTPMYYSYKSRCYLGIKLGDYAPMVVLLEQTAQIPEIVCPRELTIETSRVIKLSVVQGKSKKQCRVPFKLNNTMTISVTSEIIGLQTQKYPLIDVKPKSMTLAGKGQFSLLMSMGINDEIKNAITDGRCHSVRRVLILKIKDTKFIYHFPIQVTYYPEKKTANSVVQ